MREVLEFVTVLGASLGAGGMLFALVGLIPTKRRLTLVEAVRLHRISTPFIDLFVPPAIAVSFIAAVALLVTQPLATGTWTLFVVGAVVTAAEIVLSTLVGMPLDGRIAALGQEEVATRYPALRTTWDRVHTVRTALALIASSCYIAALVVS